MKSDDNDYESADWVNNPTKHIAKEKLELHKGSQYEKFLRVDVENLDALEVENPEEDQEAKEARYAERDRVFQFVFKKATELFTGDRWKAFVFKFYFGCDNEEISKQLHTTPHAVAVLLNNCFLTLRTQLAKESDLGDWIVPLKEILDAKKKERQKRAAKWKGKLPEGVYFHSATKLSKPFRAVHWVNGESIYLGYYATPEEAEKAVIFARNLTKRKKK